MKQVFCPASMCPLTAPNGSPWTGTYKSPCPQHDDIETGGCPWWSMACGTGGVHNEVDQAFLNEGKSFVIGPNKPKSGIKKEKTYNCENAHECSWQIEAGEKLCPPRYALSKGLDPRVCLF